MAMILLNPSEHLNTNRDSTSGLSVMIRRLQPDDIQPLAEQWKDLERRSRISFFLTWRWMSCWLKFLPPQSRPLVLRVNRGDHVVGLGIFAVRHRWPVPLLAPKGWWLNASGCPEYDLLTIEHNGLLVDREEATPVYDAVCQFMKRPKCRWQQLHLNGIPDDVQFIRITEGSPSEIRACLTKSRTCYAVDLEVVRERKGDYIGTLSHKVRGQIRKAIRLYEERGPLTITAADTREQREQWFIEFEMLHAKLWKQRGSSGAFHSPLLRQFHEQLLKDNPSGVVDLLRIQVGESTLGFIHAFLHEGHVAVYQSAFAYEDDWRLKPGLVCHSLAVGWYANRGSHQYDLLAGDSRYKRSLAKPATHLNWIVLTRTGITSRLEDLLRSGRRWFCGQSKSITVPPASNQEQDIEQETAPELVSAHFSSSSTR